MSGALSMITLHQENDVDRFTTLLDDPQLNAIGFVFADVSGEHKSTSTWSRATVAAMSIPGPQWSLAATILVKKNGDVSGFVAAPWGDVEWLSDVVEMLTIDEGLTHRHTGPF